MKKVSKGLLCFLLTLVIVTSALPTIGISAQTTKISTDTQVSENELITEKENENFPRTGDLEIGNENPEDVFVIKNASDYYSVSSNKSSGKKDIATTGASTLPSSVDNSNSKFFPKIGDQGALGSCVVFANVYYQFTYTMNKQRNVPTTDDNIFSVKWCYNFVNSGQDVGSTAYGNYNFLQKNGCPFEKSFPYDGVDFKGWSTDEKVWREAMRYKLKSYQRFDDLGKDDTIITSPDDPDLDAIKTSLANGDVLKFSSYIYDWDYDTIKTNPAVPENNKYSGEQFVRLVKGHEGGHGMAIVGYNDEIWCDINKNNKVDSGEMGAFKIANSWGESYGNKGFMWIAYDAINKIPTVSGVEEYTDKPVGMEDFYRIEVCEPREGNDIYAKITLNTADRTQFTTKFFADKNGSEYCGYLLDSVYYNTTENKCAFDGTSNACDATFIYPLSALDPEINNEDFEDYNFYIAITDREKDSIPLTIKNISIVNEHTGKEYKANDSFPKTIDGEEYTNSIKKTSQTNTVIYYIGFDNPNLHFKKSDSSTFTKVKMEENDERRGALYKYVIKDVSGEVTLYFSDDSGKTDNNNGAYYKATQGLNNYYTKNQREKLTINSVDFANGTPDTAKRCAFDIDVSGGYEEYEFKYLIENLTTGTSREYGYDYNFFRSPYGYTEGLHRVTITVRDYALDTDSFVKEFEVINHPFEITTVTQNRDNPIVSKPVEFKSVTSFEGIASWGGYSAKSRFVVTDSSGKVWADEVVKYHSYDTSVKTTTTLYNFTPHKAGDYTLTVSSTDCNKEYAEKMIRFKVADMMIGDTDGSGDITVMDATNVQRYLVNLIDDPVICLELSDCDKSELVNIMDATYIQRYLARADKTAFVGETIEYIPPTELPTEKPTEKPTETVKTNKVTFTNSFNWGGTIYCYYWSDENTTMATWPGKAMNNAGTNEFNETLYTFDVPEGASYLIFTNGSAQTTDISYNGGEMRYYPIPTTDSSGHNLVETW